MRNIYHLGLTRVDADGSYHSPSVCRATEGPLTHDGSQTTANSDMSGPATLNPGGTGPAIAGQNSSGQFLAVKIVGSRLVDVANSGGEQIYGILQNKPAAGQAADVGISGISKAVAGGVVTAGNNLMTDTAGRLVPAGGSGAAAYRVAQAIEGAAATGTIFTVAIVPEAMARNVT